MVLCVVQTEFEGVKIFNRLCLVKVLFLQNPSPGLVIGRRTRRGATFVNLHFCVEGTAGRTTHLRPSHHLRSCFSDSPNSTGRATLHLQSKQNADCRIIPQGIALWCHCRGEAKQEAKIAACLPLFGCQNFFCGLCLSLRGWTD